MREASESAWRMKIGFDGRFIRHGMSGNGVFSQHFLEGLARIDHDNEYTVYLLEDIRCVEQANFRLKRMPALHANSHARLLLTFPFEFLKTGVDVFHALYNVPLWTNSRVVLSLVEFGWITNRRDFPGSSLFAAQLRLLTRLSIKRADRILTPTETMRLRLLEYFDVPEKKAITIPFGFDERLLQKVQPDELGSIKRKFGIGEQYVVYVGDLHPRKNLPVLIDAFARLCQSRKHPHQLVLVGKDHWEAEKIKRKAAQSPVHERIIFTGYVTNDELRGLFQGASLFVFPSLDEGYGLPIHEAMACGTPVLASSLPTLREVAQDAALFFDPKKPDELAALMARALDDAELRRRLVERGRQRIKQFTWEQSCRKLLQVYEEIGANCG
jgi:glycosyltransferase involved in cell wall biosynthesis